MIVFKMKNSISIPPRRRRPVTSCGECRRRKVRCDRKEPCNSCKVLRVRCTYVFQTGQTVSPLRRAQQTTPPTASSSCQTEATPALASIDSYQPDLSAVSISIGASHTVQSKPLSLNKSRLFGQSHWSNCGYGVGTTSIQLRH